MKRHALDKLRRIDRKLFDEIAAHPAARDTIPDHHGHAGGNRHDLLTKSANVHYLEGLPTTNVIVSFSINPEGIADAWEGKFRDAVRVSPPVPRRVEASLRAQKMGFEIRWRVDPILHPVGWEDIYEEFFADAARRGLRPTRITLGMFRMNAGNLLTLTKNWGLPPLEWQPESIVRSGKHYREPEDLKIPIYEKVIAMIRRVWHGSGHEPIIAFCKESPVVHKAFGLCHPHCNCE